MKLVFLVILATVVASSGCGNQESSVKDGNLTPSSIDNAEEPNVDPSSTTTPTNNMRVPADAPVANDGIGSQTEPSLERERPSDSVADNRVASRAASAVAFLKNEHDRWTARTVVFDDRDSGGHAFFPGNWAGDTGSLKMDTGFTGQIVAGTSAVQVTYRPGRKRPSWASITWAYPDGNWGTHPGRSLKGATRLTGWIAGSGVVELKLGGTNVAPNVDPTFPYCDSFLIVQENRRLSKNWTRFVLPLSRKASVEQVIGGFTVGFPGPNPATVYLDELAYDVPLDEREPRLTRSYVPLAGKPDDPIRNVAYVYDNAMLSLAFLAHSEPNLSWELKTSDKCDSERRAMAILDSFCWAQEHDRFYRDGRWRNGYSPGPLKDPATDTARLPSIWDENAQQANEDRYVVSSDVGNISWVCLSLLTGCELLATREGNPQDKERFERYLTAARRAAEWIDGQCRCKDEWSGYTGGFEGWEPTSSNRAGPERLHWRSAEHNLDYFVVCQKLLLLTGEDVWRTRADHAKQFLLSLWEPTDNRFWGGRRGDGDCKQLNKDVVPLDVQTWGVMAMGHDGDFRRKIGWTRGRNIPSCLLWLEKNCRVRNGASGYLFSDKGSGCWPEGEAQLAAAYRYIGDTKQFDTILREVANFCPVDTPDPSSQSSASGPDVGGGIKAAYPGDAFTGFIKDFGGSKGEEWIYKSRYHVGATAWFVLAVQQDFNPFWLVDVNQKSLSPEPQPEESRTNSLPFFPPRLQPDSSRRWVGRSPAKDSQRQTYTSLDPRQPDWEPWPSCEESTTVQSPRIYVHPRSYHYVLPSR